MRAPITGRPYLFAVNRQNIYNYRRRPRGVAQLVAYVLWEHGVAGSNPVTSTIKTKSRFSYLKSGTNYLHSKEFEFLLSHLLCPLDIYQSILDGSASLNPVFIELTFLGKASLTHSARTER